MNRIHKSTLKSHRQYPFRKENVRYTKSNICKFLNVLVYLVIGQQIWCANYTLCSINKCYFTNCYLCETVKRRNAAKRLARYRAVLIRRWTFRPLFLSNLCMCLEYNTILCIGISVYTFTHSELFVFNPSDLAHSGKVYSTFRRARSGSSVADYRVFLCYTTSPGYNAGENCKSP